MPQHSQKVIAKYLFVVLGVVFIGQPSGAQIVPRSETDPIVSSFGVSRMSVIQALLQLATAEKVPLGIVVGDGQLCQTEVSSSTQNERASNIARSLIKGMQGYSAQVEEKSHIIIIGPVTRSAATEQFLSLVDDRYAVKGNPQTLATMLWVHIRAILYPQEGTAGSILGSPSDIVSEVELKNATVGHILNRIAVKVKGVWVLRPLPATLAHLGTKSPFTLLSESGDTQLNPSELCNPVPESDLK